MAETNKSKDHNLEKQIVILARHQDQQQAFLNTMESIRWKFVTAFGFGAGFALFFTTKLNKDTTNTVLTQNLVLGLVAIISTASLITQIRIYGLVHSSWHRIECLQREEARIATQLYGIKASLLKAFEFPHASWPAEDSSWFAKNFSHFLTVHMATCFVFCSSIGISVAIFTRSYGQNYYFADAVGTTLLLMIGTWFASKRYTDCLNSGIQ